MAHAQIRTSYDLGPEGRILIASLEDDPAAGAEISVTVPGRAVWEVRAVTFVLVTSSQGGSRQVNLFIDDGENVICAIPRAGAQILSKTTRYSYYPAGGDSASNTDAYRASLPPSLTLLPGWRIRTETSSLQTVDNFSAPVIYVREVPQRGVEVGQEALRSALRRLIGEEA